MNIWTSTSCYADPSVLFTSDELAASIAKIDMKTILGQTFFDSVHRCETIYPIAQIYEGVAHLVAPPDTAYRQLYTATPWADRYYNPNYSQVEIGFMIAIGILIFISLVLMAGVVALRNTSLVSASMPTFLIAMLLGSISVYTGVLIWTYHSLSTPICHLRVWLIAIGFVLIYGCMLTKSFRVWYLWSRAVQVERVVITNIQLTIVMLISVFSSAFYWQFIVVPGTFRISPLLWIHSGLQ